MCLPDSSKMPNVSVDRPCDIHFIECCVRGMKEVPHCKEWDSVAHVEKSGVVMMNCNQPNCAQDRKTIERKCNLKYWEDRRYGESLWPIP